MKYNENRGPFSSPQEEQEKNEFREMVTAVAAGLVTLVEDDQCNEGYTLLQEVVTKHGPEILGEVIHCLAHLVVHVNNSEGAEEAVTRTREQMEAYSAAGIGSVNVRQVIGLLSPTWPDGNYSS